MNRPGYEEFIGGKKPKKKFSLNMLHYIFILAAIGVAAFFLLKSGNYQVPGFSRGDSSLTCYYTGNEVKIHRKKLNEWVTGKGNFYVYRGDQVDTGVSFPTLLKFNKENNIRLDSGTNIVYESNREGNYNLRLEKGRICLETISGNYSINTPIGRVALNNGLYIVAYYQDKGMKIYCLRGTATLMQRHETNLAVTLTEEQMAGITSDLAMDKPTAFFRNNLDEWGQWNLSFSALKMKIGEAPPERESNDLQAESRPAMNMDKQIMAEKKAKEEAAKKKATAAGKFRRPSMGKENYPRAEFSRTSSSPSPTQITGTITPGGNNPEDNPEKYPQDIKYPEEKIVETRIVNAQPDSDTNTSSTTGGQAGSAAKIINNDNITGKKPASVPGMSIGASPAGPGEITIDEYNAGQRPSD